MRNPLRSSASSGSPHSGMFGLHLSTQLGLVFVFLCASVLSFKPLLLLNWITKIAWRPCEFWTHLFETFIGARCFDLAICWCTTISHRAQSSPLVLRKVSSDCFWALNAFSQLEDCVLPRLLRAGRPLVLAAPLRLETRGEGGGCSRWWNRWLGSSSVFYMPEKPQWSNGRSRGALARRGHRRELQHTGMRSPIFSPLAVQAHSADVALCLQAPVWYEGFSSLLSCLSVCWIHNCLTVLLLGTEKNLVISSPILAPWHWQR